MGKIKSFTDTLESSYSKKLTTLPIELTDEMPR